MGKQLASRCPNCGGTNLQTEPLYDYEEGPTGELALFCVSCGHYMGEMPSQLHDRMQSYRNSLLFASEYLPEQEAEVHQHSQAVREFLLGRRAASPDFD